MLSGWASGKNWQRTFILSCTSSMDGRLKGDGSQHWTINCSIGFGKPWIAFGRWPKRCRDSWECCTCWRFFQLTFVDTPHYRVRQFYLLERKLSCNAFPQNNAPTEDVTSLRVVRTFKHLRRHPSLKRKRFVNVMVVQGRHWNCSPADPLLFVIKVDLSVTVPKSQIFKTKPSLSSKRFGGFKSRWINGFGDMAWR